MPITISGSGTIGGLSAGGLPDGSITTADLNSAVPVAKAWVNFNGTGTVAIRANYNVSSITDNGTGQYTVNFTTAMSDTNFVAICTGSGGTPTTGSNYNRTLEGSPNTTSSVRCISYAPNNTAIVDIPCCFVAIFR